MTKKQVLLLVTVFIGLFVWTAYEISILHGNIRINFLQNIIQKYSVLINFIFLIIGGVGSWVFNWRLQNKKNELDKDAERHRHQLQAELIKTEIKIKQSSGIYQELFVRFKRVIGMIAIICNKRKDGEAISLELIDQIELLMNDACSFMEQNLLYLSDEVESRSDDLISLFGQYNVILKESVGDALIHQKSVRSSADKLQGQMKKELGSSVSYK